MIDATSDFDLTEIKHLTLRAIFQRDEPTPPLESGENLESTGRAGPVNYSIPFVSPSPDCAE